MVGNIWYGSTEDSGGNGIAVAILAHLIRECVLSSNISKGALSPSTCQARIGHRLLVPFLCFYRFQQVILENCKPLFLYINDAKCIIAKIPV